MIFLFEAEPGRTLHTQLRQARQARLDNQEEVNSNHSYTELGRTAETPVMAENPEERLLGDYGRANVAGDCLPIFNQSVNVPNFQLHPTTICQLKKRPFTGKVNEHSNKHLQRFLTISTTLKDI